MGLHIKAWNVRSEFNWKPARELFDIEIVSKEKITLDKIHKHKICAFFCFTLLQKKRRINFFETPSKNTLLAMKINERIKKSKVVGGCLS